MIVCIRKGAEDREDMIYFFGGFDGGVNRGEHLSYCRKIWVLLERFPFGCVIHPPLDYECGAYVNFDDREVVFSYGAPRPDFEGEVFLRLGFNIIVRSSLKELEQRAFESHHAYHLHKDIARTYDELRKAGVLS